MRRVVTGDWASGNARLISGGGIPVHKVDTQKIDAEAVNTLAREEMIDLLLTSYWDKAEKAKSYLRRLPVGSTGTYFAVNPKNEGFFLVWDAANVPSILNREVFRSIVEEAKAARLISRYHVYASTAPYTGASVELQDSGQSPRTHCGFNPRADAFNNEENANA